MVLSVLFISKVLTVSFDLISQKDDSDVFVGFMGLTALISGTVVFGTKMWTKYGHKFMSLFVMIFMCLLLSNCTRVSAGYAGIKINNYGSQRGVSDVPMVTGWVWYNPFTQNVFEYPCFVQTAKWEGDDKFSFNLSGGTLVTAEVSFSYHFDYEKVPAFWVKFRTDDINSFTHGFLHNIARDAFNEVGPYYTIEDMYSPKKDEMIVAVNKRINDAINMYGAHVDQLGYLHGLGMPPEIVAAMNSKIAATQNAIRVENELRATEAEAKKVVAKAKGEADANVLLAKSISPELIQWRNQMILEQAVQKWNGQRPTVEAGSNAGGMLLQLPTSTASR